MSMLIVALSILATLLITTISGRIMIPALKGEKGHKVFDLAPESHKKKSGTPSFGGIIFLLPIILLGFWLPMFVQSKNESMTQIILILIATIGFGIVGFVDDFIKFKKKHNDGFSFIAKFIAQVLISFIIIYVLKVNGLLNTTVQIVYWKINIGFILYFMFLVIYFAGFANATNFTDGLDGLLASNALITTLTFLVFALLQHKTGLAMFDLIFATSLIGFLYFNWNPAKIFMGDTGSLSIGGFLAANAIILKIELLFVVFGLIYIIETLSVSIQMLYFKYTKKKTGTGVRIFPMTPIHHSFEKALNWKETRIVTTFVSASLFLSIIAIILYLVGVR